MTDNRTTELLCKLLEERGVSCRTHYLHTSWRVGSKLCVAVDNLDGTLTVDCLTPEQAIAATLGGGECEIETTESWLPAERYHRCKHCGAFFAVLDASGDIPPCVCPNCGKAVKR